VAWSKGDQRRSSYVKLSSEVADYSRDARENTLELLEDRHGREYLADIALDRDEYLHLEDEDFMGDSAVAYSVHSSGQWSRSPTGLSYQ